MNDIIKFAVSTFMPGELGTKLIRMCKIQFQKVNFSGSLKYRLLLVGRIPAHTPKLSFQRFLHDETSYKPLAPVIKTLSIITSQVLHEYSFKKYDATKIR